MSPPTPLPGRRLTGLTALCWVLGILSVVLPGWMIADELRHPRGMFRHLGIAIALGMVAPVLTLLSFSANLVYARLRRWSIGWGLKAVLAVQGLGLFAALGLWGWIAIDSYRETRATERRAAVYAAVDRNDPASIGEALASCGEDCARELDRLLVAATDRRAHAAMQDLLARGARPATGFQAASRDLRTCEGLSLPALAPLEVSVARSDEAGFALLLPATDARARRRAAWLAAQLDRLALLRRLLDAGVPITLSGRILDDNATLLNAAAAGAALTAGAWLIERGFDPNGLPHGREGGRGETPLAALVRFAAEVPDSERFGPFLRLLLAHGAELEAVSPATGRTALRTAVDAYALAAFQALRAAGASEAALTPEDRARLAQMRANPPPARSMHADGPGCVR